MLQGSKVVLIWLCNKRDLEFFVHGLRRVPWVSQRSSESMSRKGSIVEQDDCSSCSSFPPLESSNEYEIVTIGVESVPEDDRNMFLVERLLESIRMAAERVRLGQDDGGVPEQDPQHPQDNVEQDPQA